MSSPKVSGAPQGAPLVQQRNTSASPEPVSAPAAAESTAWVGKPGAARPRPPTTTARAPATAPPPPSNQSAPAARLAAPSSVWYRQLNTLADALGATMANAGQSLHSAAASFGASTALGKRTDALATAFQSFGAGLANAPEQSVAMANAVHDTATSLLTRGEKLATDAQTQLRTSTHEGLTALRQGLDSVRAGTTAYVDGVKHAVDYHENISKLAPGGSYNLGLLGYVGVEGVRVQGNGNLTVNRGTDGTFTVVADGELAAGLFVEVGANVGGHGLDANLSASAVGGGAMEFRFATAEEATKAVASMLNRDAAPLAGHRSAIELRAGASALGWGLLGLKGEAALFGLAEGRGMASMRVEQGPDGVVQLVAQEKVKASVDLQGAFDERFFVTLGGANGSVELVAEHRYTLPPGVTLEQVAQDPIGLVKGSLDAIKKTRADAVTMNLVGKTQITGSGDGVSASLTVRRPLGELLASGALTKALRGDVAGALTALPADTVVEGSRSKNHTSGVHTGPWFSIMGFGVGVEVDATRQDLIDGSVQQFSGTASDVATQFKHPASPR